MWGVSCRVCVCVKALRPVNLSSCLWVAFGLHDAEGLLLLAYLLQPLLLQERHQGVSHVHHVDHLLKDPIFFWLLLWGLICQTNTCAQFKAATINIFYNNDNVKTMWKGWLLVIIYRELLNESAASLGFTELYRKLKHCSNSIIFHRSRQQFSVKKL